MVINYGDPLPDPGDCDRFGNLVFRVLQDASGLFPANDPNIRYTVPIAKDYEGEFLANNVQLCEQDLVIKKGFILRAKAEKVLEPAIPAQWDFNTGGLGQAPEGEFTIDEQLWCNPMGLQGALSIFCKLFYNQAPNWRVIEFTQYDDDPATETVILSGAIIAGRFMGLPDEFFYKYPIIKPAGGDHNRVEFKYCLQAGDELNGLWLTPFEEPIGSAVEIAICENEEGDGTPCTGSPPQFG